MGRAEYAFKITSRDDVTRWLTILKEHNECKDWDAVGETLVVTCVLDFNKNYTRKAGHVGKYLLAVNGGGRELTANFIRQRSRPGDVAFLTSVKPPKWHDCQEYLWEASREQCDEETDPLTLVDEISAAVRFE